MTELWSFRRRIVRFFVTTAVVVWGLDKAFGPSETLPPWFDAAWWSAFGLATGLTSRVGRRP
jgi:hypothetical protein